MNKLRYGLASLAVFIFVAVFEGIFHGKFLVGIYAQTAELWRPAGEMNTPVIVFAQLMFSFVFGFIFTKGYENKGIMEGVRYGILIGLLAIPCHLVSYAVQPLPIQLAILWSVGGLIEMILAGAILAAVYRR